MFWHSSQDDLIDLRPRHVCLGHQLQPLVLIFVLKQLVLTFRLIALSTRSTRHDLWHMLAHLNLWARLARLIYWLVLIYLNLRSKPIRLNLWTFSFCLNLQSSSTSLYLPPKMPSLDFWQGLTQLDSLCLSVRLKL